MARRVYVICGWPKHGKSEIAKILSKYLDEAWDDCSSIIYNTLSERLGIPVDKLLDHFGGDKERLRPELIRIGDELCSNDPSFLVKTQYMSDIRIIAGVRRISELDDISRIAWCMPLWVHRTNHPIIRDNTDEHLMDRCLIIPNTSTIEELSRQVILTVRLIGENRTNVRCASCTARTISHNHQQCSICGISQDLPPVIGRVVAQD